MSDIKVFNVSGGTAAALPVQAAQVERSLQTLFEKNLPTLLGVRFIASEYSTGPVHGGRIDTLGLDEDGSPVIIEYKRATNENVINQGLFYLDWLLDHRREFQWLVMDVLGKDVADTVDWSSPRLLCIAGDFTRYDGHAVKQIARNIELLRYRRFSNDLLMLELIHTPVRNTRSPDVSAVLAAPVEAANAATDASRRSDLIAYRLHNAPPSLRDIWDAVSAYAVALGDDVQVNERRFYHAFRRLQNFVCLEVYPTTHTVLAHLKLDPDTVTIEPGFTRDMRRVGHFGTGDLQVSMTSMSDVLKAQPLLQRAYDGN